MLYLLDGYNITRADDATRRLPLDRQRDALVARLRTRGPEILGAGRIVVVFDGPDEPVAPSADAAPVDVVFSRGETADDVIVRLAAAAAEKVVLVSSDRELRARVAAVAAHGVEPRGASAAWEAPRSTGGGVPRSSKGRGRGRFPASTAGLPPGANKITEELKGIWLPTDKREETDK